MYTTLGPYASPLEHDAPLLLSPITHTATCEAAAGRSYQASIQTLHRSAAAAEREAAFVRSLSESVPSISRSTSHSSSTHIFHIVSYMRVELILSRSHSLDTQQGTCRSH
jgi:hypothetical protein